MFESLMFESCFQNVKTFKPFKLFKLNKLCVE